MKLLGLVLVGVALVGGAAPANARVVLSVGHTDAVAPHYEDGVLELRVKDDTGEDTVFRDPADVVFHAKPESETPIPEGLPPSYGFLGEPGDSIWLLPETQDVNLLWPGFSSETIGPGSLQDDQMVWRLAGLEGPGEVALWQTEPTGEPRLAFDSGDGLPDELPMDVGTHAHYSWAFDAEGLYTLRFEVLATAADGAALSTGEVDYTFFVGDLAGLPAETAVSIDGIRDSYAPGEQVTLTAVQTPQTSHDDHRWLRRCGGEDAFAEVATGQAYGFAASLDSNGCEYVVDLRDAAGELVASSQAVRLLVTEPPAAPEPPPGPPHGDGTEPPQGEPAPPARRKLLALRFGRASVDGRRLLLGLRLNRPARVSAIVVRKRRTVARTRGKRVEAGFARIGLRLDRRLARGRYRVRVRARGGGRTATESLVLVVR